MSGDFFDRHGGRAFFEHRQAIIASRKLPSGYDERASATAFYAYVNDDPLNSIDPYGLATLQIGISGEGTILGFVVPQGGAGIVIDTQGNFGTYVYGGVGGGAGVQAGAGGSILISNAQTIYDLSGPFTNVGIHGGVGLGGSGTVFRGSSSDGTVTGGGVNFGVSAGASGSVTETTTRVCGSAGCSGPFPTGTFAESPQPSNDNSTVSNDTGGWYNGLEDNFSSSAQTTNSGGTPSK